jgi:uncharacterized protein
MSRPAASAKFPFGGKSMPDEHRRISVDKAALPSRYMTVGPEAGRLLRVFVGEEDSYHGRSLCEAIVAKALERGMAGATVLSGQEGFGRSRHLRTEANIDAGPRRPTVIEIVDTEEAVNEFLPFLYGIVDSGFVTFGKVRTIHFGARAVLTWKIHGVG